MLFVSIMWFFNRKKVNSLTDEDRESSATTRKQNRELKDKEHEIRLLEVERRKLEAEADIQELKLELYGEDEENSFNAEEMIINILTKGQGLQSLINPTTPHTPPQPLKRDLTEEQIRNMLKDVNPAILSQAKKLESEKIADFIRQKDETISEDSIKKIVVMVKGS